MTIKNRPETNETHSCEYYYGKIIDTVVDVNNISYCRRCRRRLLITQLNENNVKTINAKIEKQNNKFKEKRRNN